MRLFHRDLHFVSGIQEKSRRLRKLLEARIWLQVLVALALGVSVGLFLAPDAGFVSPETAKTITDWLALPGYLFLRLVKMMIIPLVFSSIIVGMISSGSPEFVKRLGPRIAGYFVITTLLATLIGFLVATLIQPGQYVDANQLAGPLETPAAPEAQALPERIVSILPANPLEAMVSGDMLGVVIFTIIIGVAILFLTRQQAEPMIKLLQVVQELSMTVVRWAMYLVPFAVFGLLTQVTSTIGLTALAGLSMYILTVLIGLLCLLILYGFILLIFTRKNPLHFMSLIKDVQLLAFTTSSSAAVMPLSMRTAETKLDIKPSISQLLIPVGATINMDGTALYQVVATVFLAQVFGVELGLFSFLLIIAITIGASIGAPSAPGTGIIILASILASVGIPATGIALILGVDRILDMCRTAVNVTGDLTSCSFFNARLSKYFETTTS